MSKKDSLKQLRKLVAPYRVEDGKFRLKDVDPGDTGGLVDESKAAAQALLRAGVEALRDRQDKLYAHSRWALLVVFQAMDAAGKDSAIKHVMTGVNPQGCQVVSFKQPSHEELAHDFLWRYARALPERGRIGIFNRSYYEEVLVVRVHPEWLDRERIPKPLLGKHVWDERYRDIRAFERHLTRNGVVLVKFFLHLSKKEQKKRFLERLENPEKHWKFSADDVAERAHWGEYMDAYEEMVRETSTDYAPWHVVPADNKWYTRCVVAAAVVDAMQDLDLEYPEVDPEKKKELAKARKALLSEKS
jgi:PPK2 family polyphosphate:nucleotide phosphotransferase